MSDVHAHELEIFRGLIESIACGDMTRESMIACAKDVLLEDEEEDDDSRDYDLECKDAAMEAKW